MKKTKDILIYGGAFNPPTKSHQEILEHAYRHASLHDQELILMPSGERNDKTIGTNTSVRLALLRALLKDAKLCSAATIDTRELESDEPTETLHTIYALKKSHPNRSITWIFGADSYHSMPTWQGGNELRTMIDMIFIERDGLALPADVATLPSPSVSTSSTEVRAHIEQGTPFEHLVGYEVAKILKKQFTTALA